MANSLDDFKVPDLEWLGDNNTRYEVGGRSTDVSQLAYSLERAVKQAFPVNQVPSEVEALMTLVTRRLEEAEVDIEAVMVVVTKALKEMDADD